MSGWTRWTGPRHLCLRRRRVACWDIFWRRSCSVEVCWNMLKWSWMRCNSAFLVVPHEPWLWDCQGACLCDLMCMFPLGTSHKRILLSQMDLSTVRQISVRSLILVCVLRTPGPVAQCGGLGCFVKVKSYEPLEWNLIFESRWVWRAYDSLQHTVARTGSKKKVGQTWLIDILGVWPHTLLQSLGVFQDFSALLL